MIHGPLLLLSPGLMGLLKGIPVSKGYLLGPKPRVFVLRRLRGLERLRRSFFPLI